MLEQDKMTTDDLKALLRKGPYTDSGGYPIYFVMDDGEPMSFDAVLDNYKLVLSAIRRKDNNGWRAVCADINWEDELYCAHTNERIESAYDNSDHN